MNLLKCAFFLICGPFRNERPVSLFCPTNNKALYSCAQCELLVVVSWTLAKQHQVICRSDLVRVVRLSCAAAILCLGREAGKVQHHQQ